MTVGTPRLCWICTSIWTWVVDRCGGARPRAALGPSSRNRVMTPTRGVQELVSEGRHATYAHNSTDCDERPVGCLRRNFDTVTWKPPHQWLPGGGVGAGSGRPLLDHRPDPRADRHPSQELHRLRHPRRSARPAQRRPLGTRLDRADQGGRYGTMANRRVRDHDGLAVWESAVRVPQLQSTNRALLPSVVRTGSSSMLRQVVPPSDDGGTTSAGRSQSACQRHQANSSGLVVCSFTTCPRERKLPSGRSAKMGPFAGSASVE